MNVKTLTARLGLTIGLTLGAAWPALAAPSTYQIDNAHSAATFSYRHLGLSTQTSRFNNLSGTIVLDQQAKTGKVEVTVDTRSVNTGVEAFNGHIQGADFLDTGAHPTATFVSTKVTFDGDKPASVTGDLTIKGITKPVTLKVEDFVLLDQHPMAKRPALGVTASTEIKRSEFQMGKFAPATSDDVTLRVVIEAIKTQ